MFGKYYLESHVFMKSGTHLIYHTNFGKNQRDILTERNDLIKFYTDAVKENASGVLTFAPHSVNIREIEAFECYLKRKWF